MTKISHHIPDPILVSYASGSLPQAYALVVATHLSMCDDCRARYEAHALVGGTVMENGPAKAVSGDLKDRLFDRLDDAPAARPAYARSGIFPAPVMEALEGMPPKWSSLGMGVRQSILSRDGEGSARLLYIPPGQAVPDHGHNGLELTLVLQGAFSDETGRFGVGDVEVANDDLEHTPIAEDGDPCICLAATDASLRFNAWIPRLLQPIFRI